MLNSAIPLFALITQGLFASNCVAGGASGVVVQPLLVREKRYSEPTVWRSPVHPAAPAKHWMLVVIIRVPSSEMSGGGARNTPPISAAFFCGGVTISYARLSGSWAPVVSYTKV